MLALTVIFSLFFIVGLASAIYAAVCAFRYFARGCRDEKDITLFITLVPNRIVLCIYHSLMLVPFLLPRLMPVLYDKILAYHIELNTVPFDLALVSLGIYAAVAVIIAISSEFETLECKNIFTKRRVLNEDNSDDGDGVKESNSDDVYEEMTKAEKKEQAERIMRLLGKNAEEKEDGE